MTLNDFNKRVADISVLEPPAFGDAVRQLFGDMHTDVFEPAEDDYDPKREELLRLAGELAVANERNANPLHFAQLVFEEQDPEAAAEAVIAASATHWVSYAAAIIAEIDRVSGAPRLAEIVADIRAEFQAWIEERDGGAVETPDQKAAAHFGSRKEAWNTALDLVLHRATRH